MCIRDRPIGALESDIKFPTSLTVTVEKTTHADEKEADDEEDASETGDTETVSYTHLDVYKRQALY